MQKRLIYEIENEICLIEDYMASKSKKYGEFHYDGQEYSCIEREEKNYYVYGDNYTDEPYYEGRAFCVDGIEVLEGMNEAETLEDIEFWLDVYSYTKNKNGEVIEIRYNTIMLWDQKTKEAA